MPSTKAIPARHLVPGDRLKDRGKDVRIKSVKKVNKGTNREGIRFTTNENKSYTVSPSREIAVTRNRW